jgi:hypothetical protein
MKPGMEESGGACLLRKGKGGDGGLTASGWKGRIQSQGLKHIGFFLIFTHFFVNLYPFLIHKNKLGSQSLQQVSLNPN